MHVHWSWYFFLSAEPCTLHSQYQWGQPLCYHRHQTLWGISLKCRCCAVLTKMLDVPCWQTDIFHEERTFIPTMCTRQHMLAWNSCCKFPCFIFYHIKYNWHLNFSFHAYRVNSMFCFMKVTVLGSPETLACVVHVYYLSFCCLPLWTFASATLNLFVTLQLFIFSVSLLSFKLAYNCAWSHLDFF